VQRAPKVAEKLELWPDLPIPEIYDTAGGPTRVYRVRNAVRVRLAEEVEAVADAVISPIEVEVLTSDKLADELMIAIEKPGEGLWS
jgi:hypothetical protein